jgi:hypothetical protein
MKIYFHATLAVCLSFLLSCNTSKSGLADGAEVGRTWTMGKDFIVEEAQEWTALFRRSSGWFGGDGIFAIPLNGKENGSSSNGRNLLIFSDTMIGEIEGDSLKPGFSMVNNSLAYLQGNHPKADNIEFHWAQDPQGKPQSLFVPHGPSAQDKDYYWLGDGFLNPDQDNTLYIFAYRMRNMDNGEEWSFREMGTDLIALSLKDEVSFTSQRQIETPLRFEDGGFGAGIFVNTQQAAAPDPDGYVYVYGVRGMEKHLMVARVRPEEFENFNAWRFWNGKNWRPNMEEVSFVTQGVSNELSLSPLPDGRYALVFTLHGLSPVVAMRVGDSPSGPFGEVIKLYEAKEMQQRNYITYNAKAHPSLSAEDELLISYNVNAFNFFEEINDNPYLYRPRFIKIKFNR